MKGYFIFYICLIIVIFCLINFKDNDDIVINKKEMIIVEIKGAVDNPGKYEVPINTMIIEIYNLATLKYNAVIDETTKFHTLQGNTTLIIPYGIININIAPSDELQELRGVGEATALKIIAYREKQLFKNIEELKNVSTTAYNENYDRITV